MDPMAEKHFDYTPYSYVFNNPIKLIDPFGLDSTFYSSTGTQIYSSNKDPNSNTQFVVKTTQSTDEMYNEDPDNPEKGNTNPITQEQYDKTVTELGKGNVTGDHMNNLVEIPNPIAGKNILNVIGDDGSKGTSDNNNREYATNVNSSTNETYSTIQGEVADPSKGGE
jgi:hypothetical protein